VWQVYAGLSHEDNDIKVTQEVQRTYIAIDLKSFEKNKKIKK